jgi:hypothetical protein
MRVLILRYCNLGMGMAETLKSKQYLLENICCPIQYAGYLLIDDTYQPSTILNGAGKQSY